MSIIVDSLRGYWLPGIANVEADLSMTLSDWLRESRFYVKSVDSATSFTLQLYSVADVVTLFAATANRTMSGCFESIASISPVQKMPRSLAWLIIKLYYAAFFGAHGHMRTCGTSCANLDALDTTILYDLAKIQGVEGATSKIQAGQYRINFEVPSLTLSFSAVQASGSHEALWITYKSFLEDIIYNADSFIPIQQQRDLVIEKLKSENALLSFNGSNGGNWLSKIRNLVQYRQSHGVWYPYTIEKSIPPKLLSKTLVKFKENPDTISFSQNIKKYEGEIEAFFDTTLFISSLARRTVIDMSLRSNVKNSVAKRGSIKFLKMCELD